MDDDWLASLVSRIGRPLPCDICGTPVLAEDLTEGLAPGVVIREWDMVVNRVVWVCPACPVP